MPEDEGPRIATVGQLIDALMKFPREAPVGVSDYDEVTVEFCGVDEVEQRPTGVHIVIDHTDG